MCRIKDERVTTSESIAPGWLWFRGDAASVCGVLLDFYHPVDGIGADASVPRENGPRDMDESSLGFDLGAGNG